MKKAVKKNATVLGYCVNYGLIGIHYQKQARRRSDRKHQRFVAQVLPDSVLALAKL